jgi:hypothetical protein
MEWVTHLAGERHSDRPSCVCPSLREFTVRVNDAMSDAERQRLRPYLGRMIGTAGDGRAPARAYRLVDWAVREVAPLAMDAGGRADVARTLRALAGVRDFGSAQAATDVLRVSAGAAGIRPAARQLLAAGASAARGRVPSQAAEVAIIAARDLALEGVWQGMLRVLDELLPGEVLEVPAAIEAPRDLTAAAVMA